MHRSREAAALAEDNGILPEPETLGDERNACLIAGVQSLLRDREFRKILIIKPSALGDVIHALPVLAKLRARYPNAEIDWIITPELADLLAEHPARPNLLFFERRAFRRPGQMLEALRSYFVLLSRIRKRRYDLVIDLHGQLRSAVFCLASGAGVRIGFGRPLRREKSKGMTETIPDRGWKGAREFSWLTYTHRMEIRTLREHAADRYLWLEPLLGLDGAAPDFRIWIRNEWRESVSKLLGGRDAGGAEVAVVAPGTVWETKHWTVDGFAEIARELMRRGFMVVIAGSPSDKARALKVADMSPGSLNLCGKTSVGELAALIERAALCVTNDSGPMHMAAAMGRPVVSIFGPTDPVRVGPYGQPNAVVRAGLSCSPCHFRRLRDCPNAHACMVETTAEQVLRRIDETLRSGCGELHAR